MLQFTIRTNKGIAALGTVPAKQFSSGSTGFFTTSGLTLAESATEHRVEIKDTDTDTVLVDMPLVAKDFSTGSRGFWAGGKVAGEDGLYQFQAQAILKGSKTGDVKRADAYQMQIQLVLIGSAPASVEKAQAKLDAQEKRLAEQTRKHAERRAQLEALVASLPR